MYGWVTASVQEPAFVSEIAGAHPDANAFSTHRRGLSRRQFVGSRSVMTSPQHKTVDLDWRQRRLEVNVPLCHRPFGA